MNIILKKTLRGFSFGVMGGAGIYLVFFLIELVSFIKAFLAYSVGQENSSLEGTFTNYTPLLSVWNLLTVLAIVGGLCFVGTVVGFIIGCKYHIENVERVKQDNEAVLDDGSKRQKILFAKEIKNMAETLTASCNENLYYMKNIVEAGCISGETDEEIMRELVKFIGYEQTIKELIANDREGE